MTATYKQNVLLQNTENTKKLQTNRQKKPGETIQEASRHASTSGPTPCQLHDDDDDDDDDDVVQQTKLCDMKYAPITQVLIRN